MVDSFRIITSIEAMFVKRTKLYLSEFLRLS